MTCLGESSVQEQAATLAKFLPEGKVWRAKNEKESNLYKLLLGFGGELLRVHQSIDELMCNYLISESAQFLPEWEKMVGIPDSCFKGTGTDEERVRDVLIKLASLNVITEADWEALCALYGVSNCFIRNGIFYHTWDWVWPHIWFPNERVARFHLVIRLPESFKPSTWPWTWDHPWGRDSTVLQCIMQKIKPADTKLIFIYDL
jgi:uncharacterized protein YmfQ (DUF2313 family)